MYLAVTKMTKLDRKMIAETAHADVRAPQHAAVDVAMTVVAMTVVVGTVIGSCPSQQSDLVGLGDRCGDAEPYGIEPLLEMTSEKSHGLQGPS
jgi:hypothetical protein